MAQAAASSDVLRLAANKIKPLGIVMGRDRNTRPPQVSSQAFAGFETLAVQVTCLGSLVGAMAASPLI